VFDLNDKEVVKLFYERIPFEYITKEYETSRRIHELGIPSPYVAELKQIDNRFGIIYEKAIGRNFTQILSSQPLLLKKNAHLFSAIQASFHRMKADNLPSQKEYLSRNINGTHLLSKEEKEHILHYLDQLPNGNNVCHGDYHSDNIILVEGNPKVLDWMTGTSGNPCGDVARTLMIIGYSHLPPNMPKTTKLLIRIIRQVFAKLYLNSYMKLTETSVENINKWFLPVMAARLVEGIPEPEKKVLLKKIRTMLQNIKNGL
jgi:uncharacterized protein (TIGR02172 family)